MFLVPGSKTDLDLIGNLFLPSSRDAQITKTNSLEDLSWVTKK